MHDPMTVAFNIEMPFTGKKNSAGGWDKYPKTLATIWHVDPETDGSDDSCGWFIRARHGDKNKLEEVRMSFSFEWKYLFGDGGQPLFSAQAITLHLFRRAAYEHFGNWPKTDKYLQRHLSDILWFSENPTDSLYSAIVGYEGETQDERIGHFASVIYPYILRDIRPWWKHPRWHMHHWKIQINFIQFLKRFLFSRCQGCGKGFNWGYSPTSFNWDGTGPLWFRSERGVYHGECVPAPQQINKEPS